MLVCGKGRFFLRPQRKEVIVCQHLSGTDFQREELQAQHLFPTLLVTRRPALPPPGPGTALGWVQALSASVPPAPLGRRMW